MFFDLSHEISEGMTTYPGLPAPRITDHMSREASRSHYAPGTSFYIANIEMCASTGTYMDAPFHRYADGGDLADFDLARVADLPCTVVRAQGQRAITAEFFQGLDVAGHAVLVHTGWSKHWGTDAYFGDYPYLTRDAALLLRDAGAMLVGVDSVNIDSTADPERPVHSILLRADIAIVEHMTGLENVPDTGARFFAVPPKIRGLNSFPVRAFAVT
ncbi:cyclase family protein [Desulfocurvus sp. DL9XJH121]